MPAFDFENAELETKDDIVQICVGYGMFTGAIGFHRGLLEIGATIVPAGIGNTAGGYASVVLGRGLISNATGQFIAGQYNDENYLSSMAFAVGGGSNVDNVITRKNLLTLYNDGRLRLTQPTANLTDNDVPTLKCVKEEINSSMSKVESTIKDTMDLSKYDLTFIESLY